LKRPEGRAPESHALTLAVDTTGAKFPVTIDPVISLATEGITHPEPVPGDGFGVTVAAYGNLIAIGAPKNQVGPVANAGVVYLFIREDNCAEEWSLLQKIESPSPYNNCQFGRTLSLGDGALAVSAHRLALVNGGDVLEDCGSRFPAQPDERCRLNAARDVEGVRSQCAGQSDELLRAWPETPDFENRLGD